MDSSWWTCLSKTCAFASGSHARQSSLTDLPRVEERRRESFTGALRWDRGGSIAKTLLQAIVFFGRNCGLSGLLTRTKARTSDLKGSHALRAPSAGRREKRVPCSKMTRAAILNFHHFRKDFPFAIRTARPV